MITSKLSYDIRTRGLYARDCYSESIHSVTRGKTGDATNLALDVYHRVEAMFDKIEKHSIRLIGIDY